MKRLQMFSGNDFLGSRGKAHTARKKVEKALKSHPMSGVVLDFKGVAGMSHSFTDELLSPLDEMLGNDMSRRVSLVRCAKGVRDAVELVCEMHGLRPPKVSAKDSAEEFAVV